MAKFASASKQAKSVMKTLNHAINSVGTARNYEQALTRVTEYIKAERVCDSLRGLTKDQAITYLEHRGQEVGQKTLDMERQAIQAMFVHTTGELKQGETLTVIKSEQQQCLISRAYTTEQVKLIAQHQTEKNALSTQIAHSSGLRAHELLTIRPSTERSADPRPALESKWLGREGKLYTVHGKGGLVREVLIPTNLSERLEAKRLPSPTQVTDRGIHYIKHYDIAGGKNWSNSFTSASNRCLGWSSGAHGLRHSYAQERMNEVQQNGIQRELALRTISQELGHFRPDITEVYLR